MSKHIELAKKLKALAEKGVGGEKTNAEKMLNDLFKKHNLTLEELENEKVQDFYFSIKDENIWQLLYQIVKNVNFTIKCYGEIPKKNIRELRLKGNYFIECTVLEYIEIEAKFDFYKKLYYAEMQVFLRAFIEANDLGVDDPNRLPSPLSEAEYREYLRIQGIANRIKKGVFNKQLDNKKA